MTTVIRYAIKLRNGDYMRQDFYETLDKIKIRSTDIPVDADLMKEKKIAHMVLKEILSGNTNLLVMYDEDNPPLEVVEVEINYKTNN